MKKKKKKKITKRFSSLMFTEARKSYSRKIPSDTLYVFNIVQALKETKRKETCCTQNKAGITLLEINLKRLPLVMKTMS